MTPLSLGGGHRAELERLQLFERVLERMMDAAALEQARGGGGQVVAVVRTDQPPFNDVRVRRAVSLAIDRKGVTCRECMSTTSCEQRLRPTARG